MIHRRTLWLALVVLVGLACRSAGTDAREQHTRDSTSVDAALQRYAALVIAMDHDAIGRLFADSGRLLRAGQPPMIGPAAVSAFLESYQDYHVEQNEITPDSTQVQGDSARQVGRYHQRVQLPDHTTVEVRGHFETIWTKVGTDWRIASMRAEGDR